MASCCNQLACCSIPFQWPSGGRHPLYQSLMAKGGLQEGDMLYLGGHLCLHNAPSCHQDAESSKLQNVCGVWSISVITNERVCQRASLKLMSWSRRCIVIDEVPIRWLALSKFTIISFSSTFETVISCGSVLPVACLLISIKYARHKFQVG